MSRIICADCDTDDLGCAACGAHGTLTVASEAAPATPPADDASEDRPPTAEFLGIDFHAASEGLSEAEREQVYESARCLDCGVTSVDEDEPGLWIAVERIVAARESAAATRARAEGAAEALREFADWWDGPENKPELIALSERYRPGGPSMPAIAARSRAASIARSDAAPRTGGES